MNPIQRTSYQNNRELPHNSIVEKNGKRYASNLGNFALINGTSASDVELNPSKFLLLNYMKDKSQERISSEVKL